MSHKKKGKNMINNEIDRLTGIKNEEYLKKYYNVYKQGNSECNFIMIDMKQFKSINDTLGHNEGDRCLKTFASILDNNFKDSIVVRLHGDEFAILTKYTEKEIETRFKLCNQKISLAEKEGKTSVVFKFNAGSTQAEENIDITKEKADCLMYYAKYNNITYQKYSEELLEEKFKQKQYIIKIDDSIKDSNFSYTIRELYNKDKQGQNIFQVYTKGEDGNSIFSSGRYDILKSTSKSLIHFDIYNIQAILEGIEPNNEKMMISIDYKSLISTHELIDYLSIMKDISNFSFSNVVLSIDLTGIDINQYKLVIERINELKKLNIGVRLDKFNSNIGDYIWENSEVDYIRFANFYWRQALENSKIKASLKSKLRTFNECNISSIFECIENENEHNFLINIADNNVLLSGNYYSVEKKLNLKK